MGRGYEDNSQGNVVWERGLDWSVSKYDPVIWCGELDIESLGCIKTKKITSPAE